MKRPYRRKPWTQGEIDMIRRLREHLKTPIRQLSRMTNRCQKTVKEKMIAEGIS